MSRVASFLALCSVAVLLVLVPVAHGATAGVVISQVFAGGGNAGATFANDYVELVNRSSTAVSLTGWTLQYASAASTSWQAVALAGSVRPGGYYLVKLASNGAVGAALPAAEATGTLNLAASGGKVAVVRDSTALTCGATAGSCGALVEDLVGYGTATDWEGSAAAPALGNATALLRSGAGCVDTDANASDFAIADPSPRNSVSAAASCAIGSAPSGTAAAGVSVDVQPVLSVALERTSVGFGSTFSGSTPAPVSERVTVVSNSPAGYALTVHRSAFAPADLPLAIAAAVGATLIPIPVAPATDLLLASTTAATSPAGDGWPENVGFSGPLPAVPPGHYTATITFTVIGK